MTEHVKPGDLHPSQPIEREGLSPAMALAPTPAAPSPARPARRWPKRLLAGAAVFGLLGYGADFGWQYWTVGRFFESTDDAYVAADSTVIAPKVPGYLRQVLVIDNQPVKAGQVLARIDSADYAVAVKQAKADVAGAQADIASAHASLDQQEAVIAQARSTVTLDEANLLFARQENDRYGSLADTGYGSRQNAQSTRSKLAIADATLERDRGALLAAQKQIGILTAQVAKADAVLAHDEAMESRAELDLGYADIVAPVDGTVGARTLRVGQYVQAGTALMTVVPLADAYVVANYKETQLTQVRAGQPVEVEIDTFPGNPLKGVVDSIAPASGQEFALLPPDNATGNFTKIVQRVPVRISVDRGPLAGLLRPGMSVEPTIDTRRQEPGRCPWRLRRAHAASRSRRRRGPTWPVGGALLGAFMAVLDIQITNSSLPDIEGGIGTGGVDGAWISTAYLIGEIIVIPLTDFLSACSRCAAT